jgi:hypothetical protein
LKAEGSLKTEGSLKAEGSLCRRHSATRTFYQRDEIEIARLASLDEQRGRWEEMQLIKVAERARLY